MPIVRLKKHPIFIFEIDGKLMYCLDHEGSPAYWSGGLDFQSFPSEVSQDLLQDMADALDVSAEVVAGRLLEQLIRGNNSEN